MISDILIVAGIALSAYIGYKRGFVKNVSKLCCWIISIVVAKILNPYITEFVKQSFIGEFIQKNFEETSQSLIPEELPSFFHQAGETTANGLADTVIGIVSIILIVVITFVVANFIVGALSFIAKFPLISTADRLLGFVSGILTGVLIVYLVLSFITVFNVQEAHKWFEQSIIAYTMYRHNIFMNLIF